MGKQDMIMKSYLTDKERFADLFNGIFFEGKQIVLANELQESDTFYLLNDASRGPSKPSQRLRDVKMRMNNGTMLRMLAVENQNQVDYTMPLRCMEYDTSEYRKQLKAIKHQNHISSQQPGSHPFWSDSAERLCGFRKTDRLTPIYTICLYHGDTPWDGPVTLSDMMCFRDDSDDMRHFFIDYPMKLFCVNEQTSFSTFHTELKELFQAIKYKSNKTLLKQLFEQNRNYQSLSADTVEALSILLHMPVLWENREDYMNKTKNREEYNMCKGMRDWLEEERTNGFKDGFNNGFNNGVAGGKKITIQNMLKRGFSDIDICALVECDEMLVNEVRKNM